MIKLSVTPFSIKQAISFNENKLVTNLIIGSKEFGLRQVTLFDLEMIKELKKVTKKKIFVCVNKLMHQSDLFNLEQYLIALDNLDIEGVIFADLAVRQIVKKNFLNLKLMYNTETTITNQYFTKFAKEAQIDYIELAKEITLNEVMEIANNKDCGISVNLHGYIYMYQSVRNLVTNYLNIQGLKKNDNQKYLYDDERDALYPIVEDNQGTHILASNDLCMINKLEQILSDKIDFYKLDGFLYEEKEYEQIVELYSQAIKDIENNEYNAKEYLQKIKKVAQHKKYNTGFYFKETIY